MRQFVLPGSGEDIQSRIVVEGDNEGATQPTSSFDEVARTVGIGAVKFADLTMNLNRVTNLVMVICLVLMVSQHHTCCMPMHGYVRLYVMPLVRVRVPGLYGQN